jgi:Uma2 family endonuclease
MSSVAIVDPEQLRARAPRRRLTVADYHRMGDAGILHEDDRIELIDGELFQMASIGTPHMAVVIRLTSRFGALAADRFLVSTQNSIEIPPFSEPQPDIVLLRPRADAYWGARPTPADALLVVEVADSSFAWDRNVKVPMYGRFGVVESWLVDIEDRTITVFLDPGPEEYRSSVEVRESAVSPSCLPDIAIRIDDLFPR